MIRAIVFDMDGTLVDTERLWVDAMEAYLRAKGLDPEAGASVELVFGKAWGDIYVETITRWPTLREIPIRRMQAELREVFLRLRESRDTRIPGSVETLMRLAKEYPVCIVSGSSRDDLAEEVVSLGIDGTIRFFLGSEDYSPGKPDPTCFRMAAARLGVPPETCLVFEDSAAGVRAARQAGMRCVALVRPGGPPQDVSGADLAVPTLDGFSLAWLSGSRPAAGG